MNPLVERPRKDMHGMRFGRLLVLRLADKDHRNLHWECRCDCGVVTTVRGSSLRNGHTTSCGALCAFREMPSQKTHGLSNSRTWNSWSSMRKRCEKPADPKYPDYGGRGITVCSRWDSFENFLADMGERPPGMTIERNDTNGNYEPGNCRWATSKDQQNNRRNNRWVEVGGRRLTVAQLSEACGMSSSSIRRRLARGGGFATSLGIVHEAV